MRLRATHLVLPFYLAASLLLLWPLPIRMGSAVPTAPPAFDTLLQAYLVGWDWQALGTGPGRIFDPPIFYPEALALTYMDHMIGEAILAAPVLLLGGSLALAYGTLVILSFALSGWLTYRLARLHGISRGGSLLAGFLFAFSVFRFFNLGSLNQLQTQLFPLGLFFAIRYGRKRRLRDLTGLGFCLAFQIYLGWYGAYFLLIALGALAAYALLTGRLRWSGDVRARDLSILLATLLLALPVVWPYLAQRILMPEYRRSLGEAALYSADLLDYLRLNRESWAARMWPAVGGGQALWPGLVTVLLAPLGLAAARRGRSAGAGWPARWAGAARFYAFLALVSFVLSLGPVLHVAGIRILVPLPYVAFYMLVPGFASMRAPCRFAVLVVLALSVLAGMGLDRLRRGRAGSGTRARALPAVALGLAAATSLSIPVPMVPLPDATSLPQTYEYLRDLPGTPPVLELPMPARDADENETHAMRQLYALYHGKPRLDGVSGFVSRRYREFRSEMQAFPAAGAVEAAARMGARVLVVHLGDLTPARREEWERGIAGAAGLSESARLGDDRVYAVEAPNAAGRPRLPRSGRASLDYARVWRT